MTSIKLYILLAIIFHGGGTDANGGHYNRSTGEYHYHHGHSAHSHANGCPYGSSGSSGGGYVWEITPNDSIILWIIRIFTVIFILGVAYVFIGGFYYSIKLKIKKRREAKQKKIDEKERIKTLLDNRVIENNNLKSSLNTKIKKAYAAYNDGRIKEKYWPAYEIASFYFEIAKNSISNKKEFESSIKWATQGISDFENYIKKEKTFKPKVKLSDFYLIRAKSYKGINDNLSAIIDYDRIIDFPLSDCNAYIDRGIIRYELNSYQNALNDFNYVLDNYVLDDITKSKVLFYRSEVSNLTGDKQTIDKDLNEAIRLNPKFTKPYISKAYRYSFKKNNEYALKTYIEAIKNNPDDPYLIYHRGMALFESKKYDEAMEDFNTVLDFKPKNIFKIEPPKEEWFYGSTHKFRADFYSIKGNKDFQLKELKEAIFYNHKSAIEEYLKLTESFKS